MAAELDAASFYNAFYCLHVARRVKYLSRFFFLRIWRNGLMHWWVWRRRKNKHARIFSELTMRIIGNHFGTGISWKKYIFVKYCSFWGIECLYVKRCLQNLFNIDVTVLIHKFNTIKLYILFYFFQVNISGHTIGRFTKVKP